MFNVCKILILHSTSFHQPGPCVHALRDSDALFQRSHLKLHTSHCTLHTSHSHFALCTSSTTWQAHMHLCTWQQHMQPFHQDLQPQIPNIFSNYPRTQTHPKQLEATITAREQKNSKTNSPNPRHTRATQLPFIAGCSLFT